MTKKEKQILRNIVADLVNLINADNQRCAHLVEVDQLRNPAKYDKRSGLPKKKSKKP